MSTIPLASTGQRPAKTPAQYAAARWASLQRLRSPMEPKWRDIAENFFPPRLLFMPGENAADRDDWGEILDNTPTLAANALAAGFLALVTSPVRKWARLVPRDRALRANRRVRLWLDEAEDAAFELFARSNFYPTAHSVYLDFGLFATACLWSIEDSEDVLRFTHQPAGSFAVDHDGKQRVRTIARRLVYSVAQLVEEFGLERVSRQVQDAWKAESFEERVTVLHVVEPRGFRDPRKDTAENMAFRSLWVELKSDGPALRDSGFNEFPAAVPRWETIGESPYGFGPGHVALGDAKELQHLAECDALAVDKYLEPPLNAAESLRGVGVSQMPGDVNYGGYDTGGKALVGPMVAALPQIEPMLARRADTRSRIARAFFADLLRLMLDSGMQPGKMTAREVEERAQERLLLLGPTLQRINDDLVEPLMARAVGALVRARVLPPPPAELSGAQYGVENVSLLAQAQRQTGLSLIRTFATFAVELAAIDPRAIDAVNAVAAVRTGAEMIGVPAAVMRSDEEIAETQRVRDEQAAASAQLAQADALAGAGQKGARALRDISEAEIGGQWSQLASGGGQP